MKYYLILLFLFSSCSKTPKNECILYPGETCVLESKYAKPLSYKDQLTINIDECLIHVDQEAAVQKAVKMGMMKLDKQYRLDLVRGVVSDQVLDCLNK